MKNDSYADPEEVAALEAQRQEAHERAEISAAEVAGSTGQAYPDDPFYGSDPADVKARRHTRGAFAREDYEPTADPIDAYTGPRTIGEATNDNELRSYVEYKENLTREKYANYDEIINRYVVPELKKSGVDPQVLWEWVLRDESFAEKAYKAGLDEKNRRRSKLPSAKEVGNMSVEQFTDVLESLRSAPEDEKESDEFISRREMKRMNRIANPVDFAKALDAMKWRG
jgi:hypothetical protein